MIAVVALLLGAVTENAEDYLASNAFEDEMVIYIDENLYDFYEYMFDEPELHTVNRIVACNDNIYKCCQSKKSRDLSRLYLSDSYLEREIGDETLDGFMRNELPICLYVNDRGKYFLYNFHRIRT